MSPRLDILMYLCSPHLNQNLILCLGGLWLVEISPETLECHGHQVCRASLKDTSPLLHPSSPSHHHSMECFLSGLETAGRFQWEWSLALMLDIPYCSNNNKQA